MKIRFGLLLIIFTIIACQSKKGEKPIAKEDFINLLIDLHMFDAISSDYTLNSEMGDIDSAILYSSLMQKYNTSKADFETTMHWYTKHPKEFSDIYDEVFGRVDKRNEQLNKKTRLFTQPGNINILTDTKYQLYKGDTIKYPEPYLIPIEETGTYLFDIKVRIQEDDKSEAPFLNIYFTKDEADTIPENRIEVVKAPLIKSNFIRDFQYVYKLDDNSVKFIKIILPDTPDREKGKEKHLQISKIKISKVKEAKAPETPKAVEK